MLGVQLVERCRGLYGGGLLIAVHLADVLHHAGWLERDPLPFGDGENLREHLCEARFTSRTRSPSSVLSGANVHPARAVVWLRRSCPSKQTAGPDALSTALARRYSASLSCA